MVLLHLVDESQTRLADFGYFPQLKSKKAERSKLGIVASGENDLTCFKNTVLCISRVFVRVC